LKVQWLQFLSVVIIIIIIIILIIIRTYWVTFEGPSRSTDDHIGYWKVVITHPRKSYVWYDDLPISSLCCFGSDIWGECYHDLEMILSSLWWPWGVPLLMWFRYLGVSVTVTLRWPRHPYCDLEMCCCWCGIDIWADVDCGRVLILVNTSLSSSFDPRPSFPRFPQVPAAKDARRVHLQVSNDHFRQQHN